MGEIWREMFWQYGCLVFLCAKRYKIDMKTITVATSKKDEIVDITDTVEAGLREGGPQNGFCVVFVAHTTCALTTADLDPGTDLDFLQALRHLLPRLSYRHPHDPAHAPDHLISSIIGPSVSIPYSNYQLLLGTWQRVILVELDGPRRRTLHIAWM
jgi:secondary thiamine-phosphate synthase enzyme